MHIISKKILRAFWTKHPDACQPLLDWHGILQHSTAKNFTELKLQFSSADWVKGLVVFDIAGNKYRLVAKVLFNWQRAYIKNIMTHAEYDKWMPSRTRH